jgi:acyl-CoA thioester hydrolase
MSDALPRDGMVRDGAYFFPVRVYYEDTDAAGIVYYANYLKFAERARTEMLRRLGIAQERLRRDTGMGFVVHRVSAAYRLPARLDDDLVIVTRLASLGAATLELDQLVCRDGAVLVELALTIAAIGESGRPQRLPPLLRAALLSLNKTTNGMVEAHAR